MKTKPDQSVAAHDFMAESESVEDTKIILNLNGAELPIKLESDLPATQSISIEKLAERQPVSQPKPAGAKSLNPYRKLMTQVMMDSVTFNTSLSTLRFQNKEYFIKR